MSANYYAILPANVRYDNRLKPMEKILFAELTAMTNKRGYCWAENSYFATLYEVDRKTVSRWISHLEALEYIRTEVLRDESKAVIQRRIWIADASAPEPNVDVPLPESEPEISEKSADTCPQKNRQVSAKKSLGCPRKSHVYNITSFPNTPLPPKGAEEQDKLFQMFWAAYPKKKAKQNAVRAWRRAGVTVSLFGDIMAALARAKESAEWTKEGGQYIPYPATWINGMRWEDEESNPAPNPPSSAESEVEIL